MRNDRFVDGNVFAVFLLLFYGRVDALVIHERNVFKVAIGVVLFSPRLDTLDKFVDETNKRTRNAVLDAAVSTGKSEETLAGAFAVAHYAHILFGDVYVDPLGMLGYDFFEVFGRDVKQYRVGKTPLKAGSRSVGKPFVTIVLFRDVRIMLGVVRFVIGVIDYMEKTFAMHAHPLVGCASAVTGRKPHILHAQLRLEFLIVVERTVEESPLERRRVRKVEIGKVRGGFYVERDFVYGVTLVPESAVKELVNAVHNAAILVRFDEYRIAATGDFVAVEVYFRFGNGKPACHGRVAERNALCVFVERGSVIHDDFHLRAGRSGKVTVEFACRVQHAIACRGGNDDFIIGFAVFRHNGIGKLRNFFGGRGGVGFITAPERRRKRKRKAKQ